MLDGQGRSERDRDDRAALPGKRMPGAGRGAFPAQPAHGRQSQLADDALSARNRRARPAPLAGRDRERARMGAAPRHRGKIPAGRDSALRFFRGRADVLPAGGAVLPAAQRARAAGGRNGAGQNGAGHRSSGADAAAAGADYRPAASGAQLAARNRAVSAAAGRRAGTRAARTFALRAAAGGYLHLPLSASARLEGNASQARLQNARLR